MTLSYHVQIPDTHPRELLVDLQLEGLRPGEAFALRSYASPRDSRVVEVRAFDGTGDTIALTSSEETGKQASRHTITAPSTGRALVRYRVVPACRQGDAHRGFERRRRVVVDEEFALLRGRDVFLFPDRPEDTKSARVSYTLPPSWSAWSTWAPREEREGRVTVRGRADLEAMLVSPMALGAFQPHGFELEGTSYRVLVAEAVPAPERAPLVREIESTARATSRWFDRTPGVSYLTIVLPRSSDGDDILGDASGDAQAATLFPLTTERLRTVARRFLDVHLQYPPRAISFTDPKDRWFPLGLREYLSAEIVAEVRGIPSESVDRNLGYQYGLLPAGMPEARDLERAWTDPSVDEDTRNAALKAVAPLAARALQDKVGGREAFRSWLRQASSRGSVGSVWEELPLQEKDRERLRSAWGRGTGFLPRFAEQASAVREVAGPAGSSGPVTKSVRLAFTSQMFGYLENCGCKITQSGGLARRSSVLKRLRGEATPVAILDIGSGLADLDQDLVHDPFSFAEQRIYLDQVSRMGYAAMTPGRTDLGRGLAVFREIGAGIPLPYAVANVTDAGGESILPAIRTFDLGGVRCHVIGVVSSANPFSLSSNFDEALGGFRFEDPVQAVARAASLLPASDLVVVSGEIPYRSIQAIATSCPTVDVIAVPPLMYLGELAAPTPTGKFDVSGFLGGTLVVYSDLGPYGVTSVTLGLGEQGRVARASFHRQELDDTVPDDRLVRSALDSFYRNQTVDAANAAHVRSPAMRWESANATWVGVDACSQCHVAETSQWRATPHATAMRTLTRVHRDSQPKCVSCHVVGFGTPGGYRVGAETPHLANVQCENCHGPGGKHVTSPSRKNIVRSVPEAACVSCHDAEHSDSFRYSERLPAVMHRGPGASVTAMH